MGQYSAKGTYAGYDKNNTEREANDYYATPPEEVENILDALDIQKEGSLLDPCCGGGHMIEGVLNWSCDYNINATDIKERPNQFIENHCNQFDVHYGYGKEYDFLSDEYPISNADIVIMNPPFKVIAPFIRHGLEIANKYLIVFGRTQTIETKARYEEIFKDCPPTYMYQYIDRVACAKNGEFPVAAGVQAHAWFVWDKEKLGQETILRWLWRVEKGKIRREVDKNLKI